MTAACEDLVSESTEACNINLIRTGSREEDIVLAIKTLLLDRFRCEAVIRGGAADFDIDHLIRAQCCVLQAQILSRGCFGFVVSLAGRAVVHLQVLSKGILFGAIATEGGGTGERRGGIEQVDAVGGSIRGERIAVPTAGQEVECHHPERAGRITDQDPAAYHHIQVVTLGVLNREVEDAAASQSGEVEAERQTAHLGEPTLIGIESNPVLEQLLELAGAHGDQGEVVVKPQRVLNIQGGNTTLRLIRRGVGEGGVLGPAHHIDAADLGTDTAAILQRQHHRGVDLPGVLEIGICREIPQVGFLRAHEGSLALEIHLGEAPHLAIFTGDHRLHGIGEILHILGLGAVRKGGGRELGLAHVPGLGHIGSGGRVGAADQGINAARDDASLGIEVHHQSTEIGVFVVGVDDQGGCSIGPLAQQRIGVCKVGGMARESHGLVVAVAQTGVGAGREDDVHAPEQRRQNLLIGDLLQVGHQDHLVHALGDQVVDHRLQLAGQQHHVVDLAAVALKALHLHPTGGADLLDDLGGGTDEADLFAVLGDHGRGHDAALLGSGFLKTSRRDGIGEAWVQISVGTELEVGREVGELGSNPAGHRTRREGIPEHP